MAQKTYGWLEVERIAEELVEAHPGRDPYAVRFPELTSMVRALPGFAEEPGHPVNERILETIQAHWAAEIGADGPVPEAD
ncbi:MAG TPA: Fe-S cluster assembly protein IscX [Phycisphaerales bacterium]|nr:Fe-S cluster assembly protein IscX [Phycisphaerales bacterium]